MPAASAHGDRQPTRARPPGRLRLRSGVRCDSLSRRYQRWRLRGLSPFAPTARLRRCGHRTKTWSMPWPSITADDCWRAPAIAGRSSHSWQPVHRPAEGQRQPGHCICRAHPTAASMPPPAIWARVFLLGPDPVSRGHVRERRLRRQEFLQVGTRGGARQRQLRAFCAQRQR